MSLLLNDLQPAEGSATGAWRKGRGAGSGNGKTAGKGHKGQKARSGGGVRQGFEGGQLPLYRKHPKRGFHNKFATTYATINVGALSTFESGAVVDLAALKNKGLVKAEFDGLKVLGNGELNVALVVKAAKFSAVAKEKIEKAGGTVEEV